MLKRHRFSTLSLPLSLPAPLGPRPWEQKSRLMLTQTHSHWRKSWYVNYYRSYKWMGPDNVHSKMLRDMADIITKSLSIIFENSWRLGDVPEDWKKAIVTPTYKKSLKEDPGNYKPIILNSVHGKVMKWILLGAIINQFKYVICNNQPGFNMLQLWLKNLIAFNDKIFGWCGVSGGHRLTGFLQDFW